jgi:hypothetical protein
MRMMDYDDDGGDDSDDNKDDGIRDNNSKWKVLYIKKVKGARVPTNE